MLVLNEENSELKFSDEIIILCMFPFPCIITVRDISFSKQCTKPPWCHVRFLNCHGATKWFKDHDYQNFRDFYVRSKHWILLLIKINVMSVSNTWLHLQRHFERIYRHLLIFNAVHLLLRRKYMTRTASNDINILGLNVPDLTIPIHTAFNSLVYRQDNLYLVEFFLYTSANAVIWLLSLFAIYS